MQKKLLDKTLSNKRRDCSGEHLLHEEAFLSGHRKGNGLKQPQNLGKGLKVCLLENKLYPDKRREL